jgi:hypothetical protein
VAAERVSAHDLNRWIDDVFTYRLPWGLNSLGNYLKQYAEARGESWPAVCDYYSSFVKYGVHEPVVCWLLALGLQSRAAAVRIGRLIAGRVDTPERLQRWLLLGGIDRLEAEGLSGPDAELLRDAVLRDASREKERGAKAITVKFKRLTTSGPVPPPGTRLLVEHAIGGEPNQYRLLTLSGTLLCDFRFDSELLAKFMEAPEFMTAEVLHPPHNDPAVKLYLRVESI